MFEQTWPFVVYSGDPEGSAVGVHERAKPRLQRNLPQSAPCKRSPPPIATELRLSEAKRSHLLRS